MSGLAERLGFEVPVVQAGMGGAIAGAELAGAVSGAGGLGTLGMQPAGVMAGELRRAREIAGGRPVAANLLMPFVRRAHAQACIAGGAAAVTLFMGFDARLVAELRGAGILVLHQVGTVEQARRALADGADGLIAQGVQAGGHLAGTERLEAVLPALLEVAAGRPLLAAGGIASAAGVRAALAAGAAAAVCGTRFLLSAESGAHPLYKQRALGARRTLVTGLFGFGWPDPHRVLPNAATDRWARHERRLAPALGATRSLGRRLPLRAAGALGTLQRPALPLLSPAPPVAGMPDRAVEATALYAGECARSIDAVRPAAALVSELAGWAG